MLGTATILDYWIYGDVLDMLVDTWINSLQIKPEKDEDISTGQYM